MSVWEVCKITVCYLQQKPEDEILEIIETILKLAIGEVQRN